MKSKLTPALKRKAVALARRGFNNVVICKTIGISKTTLHSKKYTDVLNAITKERDKMKDKIFADLVYRSESDQSATASILLADRLKVFKLPTFKLPKPKDPRDALDNLSQIMTAYAEGTIDGVRADRLASLNEKFVKIYDSAVTDERIAEIEKTLKRRNSGGRFIS